ncbi:MAG: hypothetical protein HRU35_06925 [Rickettsiaceae bacterium]|nr:hypothetical protein [Rickettsiaceae bacterium]
MAKNIFSKLLPAIGAFGISKYYNQSVLAQSNQSDKSGVNNFNPNTYVNQYPPSEFQAEYNLLKVKNSITLLKQFLQDETKNQHSKIEETINLCPTNFFVNNNDIIKFNLEMLDHFYYKLQRYNIAAEYCKVIINLTKDNSQNIDIVEIYRKLGYYEMAVQTNHKEAYNLFMKSISIMTNREISDIRDIDVEIFNNEIETNFKVINILRQLNRMLSNCLEIKIKPPFDSKTNDMLTSAVKFILIPLKRIKHRYLLNNKESNLLIMII